MSHDTDAEQKTNKRQPALYEQQWSEERWRAVDTAPGAELLCWLLNLHCFKSSASQLVDTELLMRSTKGNSFYCQAAAGGWEWGGGWGGGHWHKSEAGVTVKQIRMKTIWVILWTSGGQTRLRSNSVKWQRQRKGGADRIGPSASAACCLRNKKENQVTGGFWDSPQTHNSEILNLQLINSFLFSNPDWIMSYGNVIVLEITTCSAEDLVYSSGPLLMMTGALPGEQPGELISDNPWVSHSLMTLLQIISKAGGWRRLTSQSI